MLIIGDSLCKFLAKYPLASAKIMSKHFGVSASTVKEILIRELGLRKYQMNEDGCQLPRGQQRNDQRLGARELLEILRRALNHSFNITTKCTKCLQTRENKSSVMVGLSWEFNSHDH
jgi:hypothetical protein